MTMKNIIWEVSRLLVYIQNVWLPLPKSPVHSLSKNTNLTYIPLFSPHRPSRESTRIPETPPSLQENESLPFTPNETSLPFTPNETSLPFTPNETSLPFTPNETSLPFTPNETSLPFTPNEASLPFTPNETSLPFTPNETSLPFTPNGTSLPFTPNETSLPFTPNETSLPFTPNETSLPFTPNETSLPFTPNETSLLAASSAFEAPSPDYPSFTDAEIAKFQKRFEEGYDLLGDERYNLWVSLNCNSTTSTVATLSHSSSFAKVAKNIPTIKLPDLKPKTNCQVVISQ